MLNDAAERGLIDLAAALQPDGMVTSPVPPQIAEAVAKAKILWP